VKWKHLNIPADDDDLRGLRAGDAVLLSGTLLTGRDKAHQRLCEMAEKGMPLPVDLQGQFIYYVGPAPAPEGMVIGSAGPTTSYRMDPFTREMLSFGVRGMIGKGKRGRPVRDMLKEYGAVYFSSFGGAGAYLAMRITGAEVIAFEDLGPEAIYRLEVKEFPVIVINDTEGGDLYEDALEK